MKHKITFSITALILSLAPAQFAQSPGAAAPNEALRRELVKMGEDNQKHRQEMMNLMDRLATTDSEKVAKKWKQVVERQNELDSKNRQRLDEIVKDHGWPKMSSFGPEASGVAFLIVQHAELEYQKKYFPLIKESVARSEARPSDLALLQDRILKGEGKKQIYGTQVRVNQSTQAMELYPIEDEENVDARRATVGLGPLAQYLKKAFDIDYVPPKKSATP
ncbi:MAG TPA: DUF6624 domain-containing protein [Blastocatellia bacterium]|jgi:hypothetical protein|nr:DUF6624 domain-containing protein [Blastocatellia bacterium]